MDLAGVEYNAVGNHEFDKGSGRAAADADRRLRQAHHASSRARCEPFKGASFHFLAANVLTARRTDAVPRHRDQGFRAGADRLHRHDAEGNRRRWSRPAGVAGLTFADEAATANALVPALKAQGADAIVLLIHQGGRTSGGYNDKSCPELSGDILPILDRLDPAIDLVVSGHTHCGLHLRAAAGRRGRRCC